jgi:hypothetical protein
VFLFLRAIPYSAAALSDLKFLALLEAFILKLFEFKLFGGEPAPKPA